MFERLLRAEMRIAFRTDASLQIGTGHVMRCLTLADSLRERGAQCSFVCRPHAGHLLEMIARHGHQVLAMTALQKGVSSNQSITVHADWLGIDWGTDAIETSQVLNNSLGSEPFDWLVVDHYALERRWEQEQRPYARRIMVIDDLADRPHDCDLLLDQNLGRTAQDYSGLLPQNTSTLIGPQYALLRSEFAEHRIQSLARRAQRPQLKHILITMGGIDKSNATGQLLDALKVCILPTDLRITVVIGPHAPWLEQVKAQAEHMPWPTQVLVGVSNMAQLMSDSDLAIGAAGGTAWECCCLGLPSLVLALERNQFAGAISLNNVGAAITLKANLPISDMLTPSLLTQLTPANLAQLSHAAAMVADGKGSDRTADRMVEIIHA